MTEACDRSLKFSSAMFLCCCYCFFRDCGFKKFSSTSPCRPKDSSLMGGDNFKTYSTLAAVSSQSTKMNAVSKSPGSPFNPDLLLLKLRRLAPLSISILWDLFNMQWILGAPQISRLLLFSVRHLDEEHRAEQGQAHHSWKQEVLLHSSQLCLFIQWQGLLALSLVLVLLVLF